METLILQILILLLSGSVAGPSSHGTGKNKTRTYVTTFNGTEDPVSEGGNWINGKSTGIDWSNVSSGDSRVIGHQKGDVHFVDATALLTGAWGADQAVKATVFAYRTYTSDYPEVELRLRSSLTAHRCSGYEIAFSVAGKSDKAYLIIVRWNGPVGDFTYLRDLKGPQFAAGDGDVIEARITGKTITAYINGVKVAEAVDSVYSSGSPGMGFNFDWIDKGAPEGSNSSYGFTDFAATDDMANPGFTH